MDTVSVKTVNGSPTKSKKIQTGSVYRLPIFYLLGRKVVFSIWSGQPCPMCVLCMSAVLTLEQQKSQEKSSFVTKCSTIYKLELAAEYQ